MASLNVNIKNLKLKNPVMTASGTFGYGLEFADFVPLNELGGIIVKVEAVLLAGHDHRPAETLNGFGPGVVHLDVEVELDIDGSFVSALFRPLFFDFGVPADSSRAELPCEGLDSPKRIDVGLAFQSSGLDILLGLNGNFTHPVVECKVLVFCHITNDIA